MVGKPRRTRSKPIASPDKDIKPKSKTRSSSTKPLWSDIDDASGRSAGDQPTLAAGRKVTTGNLEQAPSAASCQFANLVIRASAGTGKTFQLSNRYLALLARGVPVERILATTFTRKAAGEILERVVLRLAKGVQDPQECQALAQFLEEPTLDRARCLNLLHNVLRNLHRLRIGTLDSLFNQMARTLSLEIGLPPGWRIADELEEVAARESAIAEVLGQEQTTELVRLAHLLTKGETRRGVGQLVRETVEQLHGLYQETSPEAWCSLPKPNLLARAEIESLVNSLQRISFASRQAQEACLKDCDCVLAEDWDAFVEKGLGPRVLADDLTYYRKPLPDEIVPIYQRLLGHARGVILQRVIMQTEGSYELLHKFDQVRRRLLAEQGGLRFNDITRQLDEALRAHGGAGSDPLPVADPHRALPFRLDGGVSHVLLDEFQDTAPAQWRVLRPFVDRAGGGAADASFFCVGDVKQAIYGWRGGVAQIFDAVEGTVAKVTRRQLAQSFRSSPAVIETVNRIFQGLQAHPDLDRCADAVRQWQSQFEPHSTAKIDVPGYACLKTSAAPGEGESPQEAVTESAADLVLELTRSAPDHEIAVLVRKNTTVAAIISALRRRGIAASEEGGNPLSDSAAVQLIVSLLRIGDHPANFVARFHVATSPLAEPLGFTDHEDDSAALQWSASIRRSLLQDGYGRTLQRWADLLRDHVGERDRARLEQLVELAFLYEPHATLRTGDFVHLIEQKRVADPLRAPVRVMTVHQSKGLEFDIVILPELDFALTGQTPQFVVERPEPTAPVSRICRYVGAPLRPLLPQPIQQLFEDYTVQEVSESLCVFYVALTRAARALYMVIAPSKENEKKLPRTYAGLLRAALHGVAPVAPQALLYEHGDRNWVSPPGAAKPAAAKRETATGPTQPYPQRIKLRTAASRERGLPRVAPSGLEGGQTVWLAKSAQPASGKAALRGSVFHAWFEQIQWLEEGVPDDASLGSVAERVLRDLGTTAEFAPWITEFRQMLGQPALKTILSRTTYQTDPSSQAIVETERPFAVYDAGGLMTGTIDRLVLVRQQEKLQSAEVIDFKTDHFEGDLATGIQSRVDFYRPQLEAYRRAVAAFTGLPLAQIAAQLVFVGPSRVIRLPG